MTEEKNSTAITAGFRIRRISEGSSSSNSSSSSSSAAVADFSWQKQSRIKEQLFNLNKGGRLAWA